MGLLILFLMIVVLCIIFYNLYEKFCPMWRTSTFIEGFLIFSIIIFSIFSIASVMSFIVINITDTQAQKERINDKQKIEFMLESIDEDTSFEMKRMIIEEAENFNKNVKKEKEGYNSFWVGIYHYNFEDIDYLDYERYFK